MNEKEFFRVIGEISDDLIAEAENPRNRLKRIKISKVLLVAAAVTALLSFSVFATRNLIVVSRHGYSTNIPTYTHIPSQKTLMRDVGIAPRLPHSFSCGYTYRSAHISHDKDLDADGKVVEKFKSLICDYTNGEKKFSLLIDASSTSGTAGGETDTTENYRGTNIRYITYLNKLVPGNYQLTEQDKADEANGKYVFSFGSDEIEIIEVQLVTFRCQGLNYSICALDLPLTKNELLQTAREIIDYQNAG